MIRSPDGRSAGSAGCSGTAPDHAEAHRPLLPRRWAAVWQSKARPEMLLQRLATDPHSPAEFRCNQIVRNVTEFYEAFDLTPGDRLWLDQQARVKIW